MARTTAKPKTKTAPAVMVAQDVCLSYGTRNVLDHLNLEVGEGELFGLIGLNGVGKTSFIKIMLDLRTADSGTISINGMDSSRTEARRNVAYLPERFDPPLFMTGYDFIDFVAQMQGQRVTRAAADNMAAQLQLRPDALTSRANTYSKGMRQKLGLMATILSGAPFLVLDEPMSGLDPLARVLVKDLLAACHREGRTIFLSSHILADLDELCDRVGVLHDRHFQYVGSPADLRTLTGEKQLERAFLSLIQDKMPMMESAQGARQ